MQGEPVRIHYRSNGAEIDVACATVGDAERMVEALARAMAGRGVRTDSAEPAPRVESARRSVAVCRPAERAPGRTERVVAWAKRQVHPWGVRAVMAGLPDEFPTVEAARTWLKVNAERPGSEFVRVQPGAYLMRELAAAPEGARAEADPFRDGAGREEPGAGASHRSAPLGGSAGA